MWFGRVISAVLLGVAKAISLVLKVHLVLAIWVVAMLLLPGHSGWSVAQIIQMLP